MVPGQLCRLGLLASRPNGDRAADHSMGTGLIERYAATIGPLLEMRSQARDAHASKLSIARWSVLHVPGRL